MATVASKTHQSQGPTFQLADGLRASMVSNAHQIVPNGMSPTKMFARLSCSNQRTRRYIYVCDHRIYCSTGRPSVTKRLSR
jgi:hypothetical protein